MIKYFSISLLIFCSTFAEAQTGTIVGRLTYGKYNNPVKNCEIAFFKNKEQICETKSDKEGYYALEKLYKGVYNIQIIKKGFLLEQIMDVIIYRDSVVLVDVKMNRNNQLPEQTGEYWPTKPVFKIE